MDLSNQHNLFISLANLEDFVLAQSENPPQLCGVDVPWPPRGRGFTNLDSIQRVFIAETSTVYSD